MIKIYINKPTKNVTLHVEGCSKLHQHGKVSTKNGEYKNIIDENDSILREYEKKGYNIRKCSFCM